MFDVIQRYTLIFPRRRKMHENEPEPHESCSYYSDEPDNDPSPVVQFPPASATLASQPSTYRAFFCRRTRRTSPSAPTVFTLTTADVPLLAAKVRRIAPGHVFISDSPVIHLHGRVYDYVLNVLDGGRKFELVKKDSEQIEMRITASNEYGDEIGPRKLELDVGGWHLKSKLATRKENGAWGLPYGGKFVLRSMKNAIILDEEELPVILVRKIERDALEVETVRDFTPLQLFVLGVASFLCRI
jgi:hypothetical protein